MDTDGLRELLAGIEAGRITVITRDTTEPSVLAHEILNGMPFTFLDDETEAANRRSRQVRLPRGLPVEARDLARLDPLAIARVREQVRPQPRDADELHDLLMTLFVMPPCSQWLVWFEELVAAGRAGSFAAAGETLWCATERQGVLAPLYPGAAGASLVGRAMEPEAVAAEMLRGHLDISGPRTAADLARVTALGVSEVSLALVRLETEGFALRGRFSDPDGAEEWCARRVLTRIHAYTRERKRREVEPVNAQDFMRFLLRWQHVTPDTRREGSRGVLAVVEQLQGFELAAGAWEKAILPARVTGYRKEWLDEVCLDGGVAWGRLSVRDPSRTSCPAAGLTPSRATPITLMIRDDLAWLLRAARGSQCPGSGRARAYPRRARRARRAGCAVPDRPDRRDRAAARRDRGRAVGRRGPGAAHRGRVPGRAVAVRPALAGADRAGAALAAARRAAGLADGWPLVAAALADGGLRSG